MPKLSLLLSNNRIIADVFVSTGDIKKAVKVKALIDTGASSSCITVDLSQVLNLIPISKRTLITGAGQIASNVYSVNMFFMFDKILISLENTQVSEISGKHSFSIIIGMDIIERGVLVVSGNTCVFSL
jgi:predicted aspartyl protease